MEGATRDTDWGDSVEEATVDAERKENGNTDEG